MVELKKKSCLKPYNQNKQIQRFPTWSHQDGVPHRKLSKWLPVTELQCQHKGDHLFSEAVVYLINYRPTVTGKEGNGYFVYSKWSNTLYTPNSMVVHVWRLFHRQTQGTTQRAAPKVESKIIGQIPGWTLPVWWDAFATAGVVVAAEIVLGANWQVVVD